MPDASATPDLSIVSSLYRAEAHYARFFPAVTAALRELASKGFSVEHVLVVNDASDADREAIARMQAGLADCPSVAVRLLCVPRETLYASWNRGVRAAGADVITFWNADDARSAEALAEGIGRMRSGADLVHFEWVREWQDANGQIQHEEVTVPPYDAFLYARLMWFGPFFMFRRALFEAAGPFDEQFAIAGDLEWCARALHVAQRIEKANAGGGIFSDRNAGLSTSMMHRVAHEAKWIRLRHQQLDFLSLWESLKADDFRCESARDSASPDGWFALADSLVAPTVPTDYSIAWFRKRGRPVYQMWTRVLWLVCPRYNLEALRRKLRRGRDA